MKTRNVMCMMAEKLKTLMKMKMTLLAYATMTTFLDRKSKTLGSHVRFVIDGIIASVRVSTEIHI